MRADYSFPFADSCVVQPARKWLLLGISALALSGLLALLLAAARTPALAQLESLKQLFHVALVVHVDLSVLVWFLSFACMMWCLVAAQGEVKLPLLHKSAFIVGIAATVLITLSPFDGGEPLMSNYIPVITNRLFFTGLMLLFVSVLCVLIELFAAPVRRYLSAGRLFSKECDGRAVLYFGIYSSALIALLGLACFYWSYRGLPHEGEGEAYYELLFWGGGHVLQFVYTQLMIVAWLGLAAACGVAVRMPAPLLAALFGMQLLAALASPVAYALYEVQSYQHTEFFTQSMIWCGGIVPAIVVLFIVPALLRRGKVETEHRALWTALVASLILFTLGGAFGGLIDGQNVKIPAHYHGAIVGVTLSFMGFTYLLLPKFGYKAVAHTRLAYLQPFVYGLGQIIHISGLAWSGGYGVLRKTPGALEGGFTAAKVAMGIMGLGGLLAIIGGLMFVVAVARAIYSK